MHDLHAISARMLFIVGSPRSGTTWLQRLLASLPGTATGQESDLFDVHIGPQLRAFRRDMDPAVSGRSALGMSCYHTEAEFLDLLREFMLRLMQPMLAAVPEGGVFVEKTPSHALYLPEIAELLPRARFIHMLRDGREVGASLLAAGRGWGRYWAPKSATAAARMWTRHVTAARAAAPALGDRWLEVRFEDLQADPAAVLSRGVAPLCGLSWNEEDIARAVRTNSKDAAAKGLGGAIPLGGAAAGQAEAARDPEGFIRDASPRGWRDDLTFFEKCAAWRVACGELARCGYPWPWPWK